MGAIAGEIGYRADMDVLLRMQKTLERRGPDQTGIARAEGAALIHTRLAAVDLEGGRQPMECSQGEEKYTIVYNGEIYNAEDIRAELTAKGYRFAGRSDPEVILKAYACWGGDCAEKLDGMFAFAVWEHRAKRLFVARDQLGVKPLFYSIINDSGHDNSGRDVFLFASEIKALLAHPLVRPEVDSDGVAEVLLAAPGRTPGRTAFRQIREIKPGECGYFEHGKLSLRRYWRLADRPCDDNFEQAAEKVRSLIIDSIGRQLAADVPVCSFLSGGLDSGIVSAVAWRKFRSRGEPFHTFSVGYRDNEKYFKKSAFQPNSDPYFIGVMNRYLDGAAHHDVILDTDDLAAALFEAIDARDLPGMADVDSSLLLLCREVRKHGGVALSGEGADEIFGGYRWYREPEMLKYEGFPWLMSADYRASFIADDYTNCINPLEYARERYESAVSEADVLPGTSPEERRIKEMMQINL
ncbi:MAG: asparagine synthase (glutamine-hydrolyzing), partial [Oscillospiraceae bacterium]|nr:asparagine synthase (glutamine-hydrolyzing) [Oscillospiraceae bacterium]